MIKVSVIVPVYNSKKYLVRCLDSLINQTLKDIEIIIVSDGSTDESNDIIKDYALKYSNVKAFYNSNQGAAEARNFGLNKAVGKYISFVDSDDYVDLNFLLKMYNYAKKNKLDITVCDYYKFYESEIKVLEKLPDFSISDVYINPTLIFIINSAPWNKLYKRELFKELKFPKIKYEDFAIMTYLLFQAQRIGKLNVPLNYYLIRDKSETDVVDKRCYDILTILKGYNLFFKEKSYFEKNYAEIEYFNVEKVVKYIVQQRVQRDKTIIKPFINECFIFLNTNFPNWKKNKYYKKNGFLKRIIETNKLLSLIYCKLYQTIKGKNNEKTR